jgi:hypothetical protein
VTTEAATAATASAVASTKPTMRGWLPPSLAIASA